MKKLLHHILSLSERAGKEILQVYNNEFDVAYKGDGSPLTEADRRSHRCIVNVLQSLTPDIPVLSEESETIVFDRRREWKKFWLIDPLDGTKEFVKRNGEFTVNIALVDNGRPVLGVVHTPIKQFSHFAAQGVGAFKCIHGDREQVISIRTTRKNRVTMVASRSHSGAAVEVYRENLENQFGNVDIVSMGSSLKICLVAEGTADIYPRLGPTSEWDTAAAHCILEAAGGSMINVQGQKLLYNKENILNPWFLACGDPGVDWTLFA